MTGEEKEQGELESNVQRLFRRLERGAAVSDAARDRILERLLEETSHAHAGHTRRRWVRWAGLAAALFVVVGLAAIGVDELDVSRDRGGEEREVDAVDGPASGNTRFVSFAIHLLAEGAGGAVVEASTGVGGEPLRLEPERQVSNLDVESASVKQATSGCEVEIRLTEEGTDKLARLTRDHIGERLALVIDGEVVMAPTIRSEISEGLVRLTGDFTDQHCQEIAAGLTATR